MSTLEGLPKARRSRPLPVPDLTRSADIKINK